MELARVGYISLFVSLPLWWGFMEGIAPISVTYKFVGYINNRGDNKICNLSFSTNVRGQLL